MVFTFKEKTYTFDSYECYENGPPYFIGLPDGKVLKVASWDRNESLHALLTLTTAPQPKRIFNMDMSIPEGAKLFPATEVIGE